MKTNTAAAECFKCLGRGRFETFSHVAGGVCFQCGGTGKLTLRGLGRTEPTGGPDGISRERCILDLKTYLNTLARIADERGIDEATECAREMSDAQDGGLGLPFFGRWHAAPDDVRARFVAALARIGISL